MLLSKLAKVLLLMPRYAKRSVALMLDAMLCVMTVWIAFGLRLDQWDMLSGVQWLPVFISLGIAIPLFLAFGLYRAIFRYSGWTALMTMTKVTAAYGLFFALTFTVIGVNGIPRTLGIIQPVLLLMAVGGSRIVVRYWLGGVHHARGKSPSLPRVLIYGAGSAGRQLAAALFNSREMTIVGFLDNDKTLQGNTINGLKVFNPEFLSKVIVNKKVTDVLLAIPSASRARRNEILAALQSFSLHVRTLPSFMDLAYGRSHLSDVRELDIEDLLGRDPVVPNSVLISRNILGKVVLVTGAGGSIGSELCRQIIKSKPAILLLVEVSEYALYAINNELLPYVNTSSGIQLIPLLASVREYERMKDIVRTWRPDTVYHAAAYKHVPLVEQNPVEGLRNNVIGTLTAARVAMEEDVESFVLISTDKAVRPTNIMGASKRLAEMVLQGLAASGDSRTKFSMVRFGNVLGSSGSVVPLFRDQIKAGGPITVTHPEITRYFMTIPEAAQLVIQAGAMATGGDVFVLEMGQPVRILDLACSMLKLSGLKVRDEKNPDGDIEIKITGLRPGEKLYEELLIGNNPKPTQHPRIMKAHEEFLSWEVLKEKLQALNDASDDNDISKVRLILKELVSGYIPSPEIVDWIHLKSQVIRIDKTVAV